MAFWITLFRSMFAITLGIALVFQPDKARPMLANFMGMFWLASGLLSLRWGIAQAGNRWLELLVGAVGILAGLGTLGRGLAQNWIAEDVVLSILGVVVLLTGLLHISGRLKARQTRLHQRQWSEILLGIFEIFLGGILIVSPLDRGPLIYTAIVVWALLGGFILLGDALFMRQQARSSEQGKVQHGE